MILNEIFFSPPDAVERLGKNVFLETPLYRSKKPYKFIYINKNLFQNIFEVKEKISRKEMSGELGKYFNSTIDPTLGTDEVVATAYVDYQMDPLDISMHGNLGSGRAYYVGKYFNIKGEKTPLATSLIEKYSNGFLEMERGIWETWISNSLQNSLTTKLCKVLAILDIGEVCHVPWRPHLVKRVKIIRIDQEGELDRVTHYFYNKNPLPASIIRNAAACYGKLEADKFIERILHGAWSLGNISLEGHLIDYDSVVAVKGRVPQFSFTKWHYQNYFGYESKGQLKILKTLCLDQEINKDKVNYLDIKKIFLKSFEDQCAKRFVHLMGFEQVDAIYTKFQDQLLSLSMEFMRLSRKCIPTSRALFAKNFESLFHYLFDFSSFFRVYPMLRRYRILTQEKAFTIGLSCADVSTLTSLTIENESQENIDYITKNVYKYFKEDFIINSDQYQKNKDDIKNFINLYDQTFSDIINWIKEDIFKIEANAYKINEDRFYLFAPFTLSYSFSINSNKEREEYFQELIQIVTNANNRFLTYKCDDYICNIRIYHEGYYFLKLNCFGSHQHSFIIFKKKIKKINFETAKIIINNEIILERREENDNYIKYSGDFIRNKELLNNYNDLSVLENRNIVMNDGSYLIEFVQYEQ